MAPSPRASDESLSSDAASARRMHKFGRAGFRPPAYARCAGTHGRGHYVYVCLTYNYSLRTDEGTTAGRQLTVPSTSAPTPCAADTKPGVSDTCTPSTRE